MRDRARRGAHPGGKRHQRTPHTDTRDGTHQQHAVRKDKVVTLVDRNNNSTRRTHIHTTTRFWARSAHYVRCSSTDRIVLEGRSTAAVGDKLRRCVTCTSSPATNTLNRMPSCGTNSCVTPPTKHRHTQAQTHTNTHTRHRTQRIHPHIRIEEETTRTNAGVIGPRRNPYLDQHRRLRSHCSHDVFRASCRNDNVRGSVRGLDYKPLAPVQFVFTQPLHGFSGRCEHRV